MFFFFLSSNCTHIYFLQGVLSFVYIVRYFGDLLFGILFNLQWSFDLPLYGNSMMNLRDLIF